MTESYVERNRETWSELSQEFAKTAEREWAGDPVWGIFLIPEADVQFFPGDVAGLDTIELGCGTAYVSAWLSRLGAKPIGIDVTPEQLETARQMQSKFGISFPLVEGNAEATPFADASCDLVVRE
ncbi:MAG TPA: class I SAM-dependent methyltransferase [Thermomicrobiales bacterium]|nr:class I SAM-dependent methyltransferase [Thermomicrobiales bacterium]